MKESYVWIKDDRLGRIATLTEDADAASPEEEETGPRAPTRQ
jgi:hypothetical protein